MKFQSSGSKYLTGAGQHEIRFPPNSVPPGKPIPEPWQQKAHRELVTEAERKQAEREKFPITDIRRFI